MTSPFTRALYDQLPEGFPAELVDGALVREPAPSGAHQTLVGALFLALAPLAGLRRTFVAPIDVGLDDLNVLQPDVAVYDVPPPLEAHDLGVPAMVFEVLSPSTRKLDRTVKAGKYLRAGTREVWLVDPDLESVEVRTAGANRVFRAAEEARSQALAGFVVVPDVLFSNLRP